MSAIWRAGSPNAAVLPVPVLDWPRISLPSSAGGIRVAWITVGNSNPWSSIPLRMFGFKPRSAKVVEVEKISSAQLVNNVFEEASLKDLKNILRVEKNP